MTKQEILSIIESMPDDITELDAIEALEKVRFVAKVQKGLDQLDRGQRVPHSEVKTKITGWLER